MDNWKQEPLELNLTVFITNFPETTNGGNEWDAHYSTWQSRSSLTSSKNPLVKSSEAEDLSFEAGGSNWYSLTSMVKVKKLVKPGQKWQKMGTRARQTEAKTQQKLIALFGKPSNILLREGSKRENPGKEVASWPTCHAVSSPSCGHFRNVFVKTWIVIFYPSRKPWGGKSVPKSPLGWFFLVFGEGKATKENSSIFWIIWLLIFSWFRLRSIQGVVTNYFDVSSNITVHILVCLWAKNFFQIIYWRSDRCDCQTNIETSVIWTFIQYFRSENHSDYCSRSYGTQKFL